MQQGKRELFGGIEMFYILISVVVTQMYTAVKIHQAEYFKWCILFIRLCHNKVDRGFGNTYKNFYCSITLIAKKLGKLAVSRRMSQLSVVLCHQNGKLVVEDAADADNDPLMSLEPASLFLEALSGDWSMHGADQKCWRINIPLGAALIQCLAGVGV